jgi:hypothetical protein
MPMTPFVVGLWPSDDASAPQQMLRTEFGANYYSRTLREAVEICVRIAKASRDEPDRQASVSPPALERERQAG